MLSADLYNRENRIKHKRIAAGDNDFKILLKNIWVFLDELDVILKIFDLIKWSYGEDSIVLSLKTKAQTVAPEDNSWSIMNLQRSDPAPYLAWSFVVRERL